MLVGFVKVGFEMLKAISMLAAGEYNIDNIDKSLLTIRKERKFTFFRQ